MKSLLQILNGLQFKLNIAAGNMHNDFQVNRAGILFRWSTRVPAFVQRKERGRTVEGIWHEEQVRKCEINQR